MPRLLKRTKTSLCIMSVVAAAVVSASACKKETNLDSKKQHSEVTAAASPRSDSSSNSSKPRNGYIADEQTAIAIAVATWIPIYGKAAIEREKPYQATLKKGVWTVTGTLPAGYVGGTALAEIAQDDGRILRVTHYK